MSKIFNKGVYKLMKKDELKKYDGKDGREAYIAYDGKIYDVTKSKYWKNGTHMLRHKAGEDLTEFLKLAPHGFEVFENFKEVDVLEEEVTEVSERLEFWREIYKKYHPHPMLIHFPMGLMYFSAFMYVLHFIFKNQSFDLSALYSLIGAFITTIPAAAAGIVSWIINYNKVWNNIFRNKLVFTIVFLITSFSTILLRITLGDITLYNSPLQYLYLMLYIINLPIISFIAYNGGKITWP
jgi:predicted heme/steroid binding protein/uncharacterized membrane protein